LCSRTSKSSAICHAIFLTIILTFALPTAIALFPQEATADAAQLEPEFHNLRDPVTGERIASFNKGTNISSLAPTTSHADVRNTPPAHFLKISSIPPPDKHTHLSQTFLFTT
jgi:Sideroflexins